MSIPSKATTILQVTLPRVSRCLYSTESKGGEPPKPAKAASKSPKPVQESAPKVAPVEEPPSDNTKYQCDIYLNHDAWSFYNTEAQMTARRVGQPSSKVKPTV